MTLLLVCVAIGVVAAVAVLLVRDRSPLEDDPADARRLRWLGPEVPTASDLADLRFTVVLRGYRMDEVDQVLARLRDRISVQAALIEALTAQLKAAPRADAPTDD